MGDAWEWSLAGPERSAALWADAQRALTALYEGQADLMAILSIARNAATDRNAALRALDAARLLEPEWFLSNRMLGYSAYVDRFAENLAGVETRIPYLAELGVTYLHLLPFLKMPPQRNDGGFAVSAYDVVEPAMGSMADLERLTHRLRSAGISLCADFLLNHTADDHPWALAAKGGDATCRAYYHIISDQAEVAAWEASLPQVFAETAPGNFTYAPELQAWVWTTFYPFQWDLNWANPAVFAEMLRALLHLANRGVEVFRLDSAPFLWKRPGTDCRNQPETHLIIQALRALAGLAAPGVLLKAEAIVPSANLPAYLGMGRHAGKECHIAYHTSLMTLQWVALAEQDARPAAAVLGAMPPQPPGTAWLTYVRCHDDIGWSVLLPEVAEYTPEGWRALVGRLGHFFADGATYAAGESFQTKPGETPHGVSGSLASLCGLERALAAQDQTAIDAAVTRILLMLTVCFGHGGIPLIYMGDELGQLNDRDYRTGARFDGDNRWLHRGAMNWQAAERRRDRGSIEQRLFEGVRRLMAARRASPPLTQPVTITAECAPVLSLARPGLLVLANFSEEPQSVALPEGVWSDLLDAALAWRGGASLGPLQARWLLRVEE